MSDPTQVEPSHLLRAALDDTVVRQVLELCGADHVEVRITLERRCLDALDGVVDPDVLAATGVDVAQLLRDLGPVDDHLARRWDRSMSTATRNALLGALGEAAATRRPVAAWHLLVGLAASSDPVVAATLAEHRVRQRDVRRIGRRIGRRA